MEARKKLDAIADKIGYPEHWRDYSTLIVKRDDYLGNRSAPAILSATATWRSSASLST